MNQTQLIDAVADSTGLDRRQAAAAVTAALDTILATVTAGGDVTVTNFGTFRATKTVAGKRRNPRTGEIIQAPAMARMRFRVSARARQIIAAGDPQASRRKAAKGRRVGAGR
ncbi:HU family DNA-binding protein [Streptomyces sp. CBMA152]|uniref:HU family DNA-binding protein n=1 Tax=Streptomyces sp. CBMA152 TaxID=1896312 RepID=UPI0016615B47|nr:HU family DNA-binding protein [Streptomyces sp. CBMA152]MBD0743500.1 hypothetical protein [Streptomyces sp. CBMA152]